MHQLEQPAELVFAPGDDVGQKPQLPAEIGQWVCGVVQLVRRALAAAELTGPSGISIQPILQVVHIPVHPYAGGLRRRISGRLGGS
jgi:hypothetical protein